MMTRKSRTPLTIGWQAVKANALPGFVLQAAMLSILLAYYFSPTSAALLNQLADYKRNHQVAFVIIASVCAGALLPELFVVCLFQRGRVRRQNFRDLLFTAPFWAFDGVLVDLMYRTLAIWFGMKVSVPVVVAKICVDLRGVNFGRC